MSHYKSNVRDLEFNLFEVLGLGDVLTTGAYGDLDADMVRQLLDEARRFAEGPLAASFVDGDRHPPVFDPVTHSVSIEASFKKSVLAVQAGPDVRRSLMMQKAYVEGLRGVLLYTAAHQNRDVAREVFGIDADLASRVNDLLLPIVKGVGSERAFDMLTESMQILGGSGYLQDYPIEQYLRDTKIDTVYEGTTAIQALDFFFRKIARDQGGALTHVLGQVRAFVDDTAGGRFKTERALLATALDDIEAMVATLTSYLMDAARTPTELYKIGLASVRFLMAVGDLLIGWRLLVAAQIALAALDAEPDRDAPFYRGKIGAASFFANDVLPQLTATRGAVARINNDIMELDDAAF